MAFNALDPLGFRYVVAPKKSRRRDERKRRERAERKDDKHRRKEERKSNRRDARLDRVNARQDGKTARTESRVGGRVARGTANVGDVLANNLEPLLSGLAGGTAGVGVQVEAKPDMTPWLVLLGAAAGIGLLTYAVAK